MCPALSNALRSLCSGAFLSPSGAWSSWLLMCISSFSSAVICKGFPDCFCFLALDSEGVGSKDLCFED